MIKRQVVLKYGFNAKTLNRLLSEGILVEAYRKPGLRPEIHISDDSLAALQQGVHYIVCAECGAYKSHIMGKHLQACSGITLAEYQIRHPNRQLLASITSKRKVKTEEQKKRQSETLKERFAGPAGANTRAQISAASVRMQALPYGAQAAAHLRALNQCPENRRRQSKISKALWKDTDFRRKQDKWRSEHRSDVLVSAAYARAHLVSTFTRPHRVLKYALLKAGIASTTEYLVEFYSIDEAVLDSRIAIEADGCYWHGCEECGFPGRGENATLDARKNTFLSNNGWTVLRFKEHEILENVDACVKRVIEVVQGGSRVA